MRRAPERWALFYVRSAVPTWPGRSLFKDSVEFLRQFKEGEFSSHLLAFGKVKRTATRAALVSHLLRNLASDDEHLTWQAKVPNRSYGEQWFQQGGEHAMGTVTFE
jgi:hypothetical protein